MKYFIGVDPSLRNTGVAIFEGDDLVKVFSINTSPKDSEIVRRRFIFNQFLELFNSLKEEGVILCIEDQFIPRFFGAKSSLQVAVVRGLIESAYMLVFGENEIYELMPRQAKAFFLKGKKIPKGKTKQYLMEEIKKFFPKMKFKNMDITDAVAVGLCGSRLYYQGLLDKNKIANLKT